MVLFECKSDQRSIFRMLVSGALCLGLWVTVAPAQARPTAVFTASTFDELDKGEPKGTQVSSEGEVTAGRGASRIKLKTTMIWSSARAKDGTVYLGSGDKGIIHAVKDGKVRKVADLKTILVTALAIGRGGKLLAATMPGARILEVDPKKGSFKELAKVPAEHVWAVAHDPKSRRIYAASGSPGKVFDFPERGGKPQVYFDPEEKHLLCLALGPKGTMLVGSSDKAILYRVKQRGVAEAVHDFDANELKDVVIGADGALFVAVNKFESKTSGLPRLDKSASGEGGTAIVAKKSKKKAKVQAKELRPGAKKGKGGVFRIAPDGATEQLHALAKGYFTDLALDKDGVVWAAEGTQGKVFRLHSDGTVQTALDLAERQVLVLALDDRGSQSYLGTGDAGGLYRLSAGPGKDPHYLSQVFDAKGVSRWGKLRIHVQGGAVQVHSRSGNTAKPDKTWAPWRKAAAAGGDRTRLTSAPARYLQLKLAWKAPHKARLRSFSLYHLPQNPRHRVKDVTFARAKAKGKGKPRTPVVKVSWKVDNPDKDELVYRLYLRSETGTIWRRVDGPDPLEKKEFSWDTAAVPDGHYRLKVAASDERQNPPSRTRVEARISERVLVDNRKPTVRGLKVAWPKVSGTAEDSFSTIARIEYTLNGRLWRLVAPTDGIYDSPSEAFSFRLVRKDLPAGDHLLAVRVTDEAGNVAVRQLQFRK